MKKIIKILSVIVLFCLVSTPVLATNTKSHDLEKGNGQFLSIADVSQTGLDINSDFTIEAWIKLESSSNGNIISYVGKYASAGTRQYFLYSYNNAGAIDVRCNVSSNASTWGTYGVWAVGVAIGEWHHLACTYTKSTGKVRLYYDTVSQGDGSNYAAKSIANSTGNFEIGRGSSQSTWVLDGLIDEVRIWTDVRTQTEIEDNWKTELNGDETNLLAYYKFNDSNLDKTTSNNDLTFNTSGGSEVYSTDVPFSGATPPAIKPNGFTITEF